MTAFVTAQVTIKDPEKYKLYGQKSAPTLEPFGGKVIIKGKNLGNYTGSSEHDALAIITFPNYENMDAWYHSEAYQALLPLRDEAAGILFTKHESL